MYDNNYIHTISNFSVLFSNVRKLFRSFQETSLRAVHMPSAVVTFGLGLVYNVIHTEITRVMSPRYSSVCVWGLRLCISMTGLLAFVLCKYQYIIYSEAQNSWWEAGRKETTPNWLTSIAFTTLSDHINQNCNKLKFYQIQALYFHSS